MLEKVIGLCSGLALLASALIIVVMAVLFLGGACWAALSMWKAVFAFFM